MSFDMTEKLIHSTPLDDDTAQMMMELDIRKESVKEMNEEMKEEKEDKEGNVGIVEMNEENRSRVGKDGRKESDRDKDGDEDMIRSDQEIVAEEEEKGNVLEAFHTQDSG
jgi:hypothetical protein